MLYMKREYSRLLVAAPDLQGCFVVPDVVTAAGEDVWRGVIFIREKASPWTKGAFPFTITFPANYPLACPRATFDTPFASHPSLKDGVEVPFELEFSDINPMSTSVLVRLLRAVRKQFVVSEENRALITLSAAKSDVARCSITASDRAAYMRVFGEGAVKWLLDLDAEREATGDLDAPIGKWRIDHRVA
jgi:ubiquitin-protein ligase